MPNFTSSTLTQTNTSPPPSSNLFLSRTNPSFPLAPHSSNSPCSQSRSRRPAVAVPSSQDLQTGDGDRRRERGRPRVSRGDRVLAGRFGPRFAQQRSKRRENRRVRGAKTKGITPKTRCGPWWSAKHSLTGATWPVALWHGGRR